MPGEGSKLLAAVKLGRGEELQVRHAPGGADGLLDLRVFGRRTGPTKRGFKIPPEALPSLIVGLQTALAALPR